MVLPQKSLLTKINPMSIFPPHCAKLKIKNKNAKIQIKMKKLYIVTI